MNVFLKDSDTFDVEIYYWTTEKDTLDATHDKSAIPEKVTPNVCTFTFRHPTLADSVKIRRTLTSLGVENWTPFQEAVLQVLLVDWSLTNNEGTKEEFNKNKINTLCSKLALAAAAGCLSRVEV